MLKNKITWSVLLFCLLPLAVPVSAESELENALAQFGAPAQTQEIIEGPPPAASPDAVYAFHDHLFSAEAVTVLSDGRELTAEWRQPRFVFQGLDSKADIRLVPSPGGGTPVIEYHPLPRAVRRILFYDSLPGRRIVFHYRLDQEKKTKENNYMTLTVWAGRHPIKRMRFMPSAKGGWQKEVIELKEAAFLNGGIPIAFEIGPDPSGLLLFKIIAEISR